MKRDIAVYLEDVLNSINHIEKYTKNLSSKNFEEDTQVQDAVVRRLEIIGEAVKNIPASFRKKHSAYSRIFWSKCRTCLVGSKRRLTKTQKANC